MGKKHDNKPTFASMPQVIDMQRLAGIAFSKMPKSKANQILGSDASQKTFIRNLQKLLWGTQVLNHNPHAMIAIPLIIDYYEKVFAIDVSEIAEMEFPEHATLQTYMAVSPKLDEDQIMICLREYFKINLYRYKESVAKNINREREQKRPDGLYVFAHSGQDEPDADHCGKSYNDAIGEQMVFANAKEYLLMTGFHKFTKGYFMDKNGWTHTSSLWSGGSLVCADWSGGESRLRVGSGLVDSRDSDRGPRQLIL